MMMMISLVFKFLKKSAEAVRFFLRVSSWLRVNSNALQDGMPNKMINLMKL